MTTLDPDNDRMMTVEEVAKFFSVTTYTVRQWLTSEPPVLRGGKVNGKWRVLKSEVVRYAQATYGKVEE